MDRKKLSVGFKIIAYISIVVGAWMTLATILIAFRLYSSEIPVGAIIIALLACVSLLVAGIGALRSIKAGLYLYLGSSIIWLTRAIIQVVLTERSESLSTEIVAFLSAGGIWLILSILGIIVCYYEIRKVHDVVLKHNEN